MELGGLGPFQFTTSSSMFVNMRFKPNQNTFNLTQIRIFNLSVVVQQSPGTERETRRVFATGLNADIILEFYSHCKLQVETADCAVTEISVM